MNASSGPVEMLPCLRCRRSTPPPPRLVTSQGCYVAHRDLLSLGNITHPEPWLTGEGRAQYSSVFQESEVWERDLKTKNS